MPEQTPVWAYTAQYRILDTDYRERSEQQNLTLRQTLVTITDGGIGGNEHCRQRAGSIRLFRATRSS